MKKLYIAFVGMACLCLACSRDDRALLDGEGTLRLRTQVNDEVQIISRAGAPEGETSPEEELKKNCRVRIYKGEKLIYKHAGWDATLQEPGLSLSSGAYRVRIISGDSVDASFDKKYYEGNESFEIRQAQTTPVEVVCNVMNTLAKVVFDASLEPYLEKGEVSVAVDVDGGSLTYPYQKEAAEAKTGYYSLPQGKEYLICTFTGVAKNGRKFTQTNRIESAKKSTLYTLTYKISDLETPAPPTDEGGAFIDLKVDETPLAKKEEEILIYQRPQFRAVNQSEEVDMKQPWFLELNSQIQPEVKIYTSTPLAEASVTSEVFTKLGLASAELNLMDEATRVELQEKGIMVTSQEKLLTMNWGNSLNDLLKEEGEHHIIYKATDTAVEGNAAARTNTIDWTISVSNANIRAVNIPYPYQIWADRVTLYAEVINGRTLDPNAQLSFRYRKKEDSNWIDNIKAKLGEDQKTITSDEIKGLTPGTTYEYQVLEGDKVSNQTCEFTTEAALQLPNSGFENWSGDSPKLIHGSGEEMFWDSGNHGSATLKENVTTPDGSVKHGGNYSAKLESKFVAFWGIGKFAAGNLFIGDYLKTDGTDGILGIGRPMGKDASGRPVTSRPLALRGYIKYISGKVDYGKEQIPNGSQDIGIIYMALTDGEGKAYENSHWSFIIKTKEKLFFDKNAADVIAYGEKTWEQSTEGEGMIPFEIRFDYDAKPDGRTRIPNRILIVAAASKFGDYFEGSTGSKMWLDDLELIYEESKLSKQ